MNNAESVLLSNETAQMFLVDVDDGQMISYEKIYNRALSGDEITIVGLAMLTSSNQQSDFSNKNDVSDAIIVFSGVLYILRSVSAGEELVDMTYAMMTGFFQTIEDESFVLALSKMNDYFDGLTEKSQLEGEQKLTEFNENLGTCFFMISELSYRKKLDMILSLGFVGKYHRYFLNKSGGVVDFNPIYTDFKKTLS